MVQTILGGRKTQTRRIIKKGDVLDMAMQGFPFNAVMLGNKRRGDILWVRETHRLVSWDCIDGHISLEYKDGKIIRHEDTGDATEWLERQTTKLDKKGCLITSSGDCDFMNFTGVEVPWSPSIFLPKWGARIFLEITDMRVERLQDISEGDAIKEGVLIDSDGYLCFDYERNCFLEIDPTQSFETLWQSINGNWDANPFVWVIEFKITDRPQGF